MHPRYLDSRGLVALWREALLAQKVLKGETKGYRHHPQLCRFKGASDPLAAIASYLKEVCNEADRRGYIFNSCKISCAPSAQKLPLTRGQLRYEFALLRSKLSSRDPEKYKELEEAEEIEPHPLFYVTNGDVATWERVKMEILKEKDVK